MIPIFLFNETLDKTFHVSPPAMKYTKENFKVGYKIFNNR